MQPDSRVAEISCLYTLALPVMSFPYTCLLFALKLKPFGIFKEICQFYTCCPISSDLTEL